MERARHSWHCSLPDLPRGDQQLLKLTLSPASLAHTSPPFARACAARLAPICRALLSAAPRPSVRCCSACQGARLPTLRLEPTPGRNCSGGRWRASASSDLLRCPPRTPMVTSSWYSQTTRSRRLFVSACRTDRTDDTQRVVVYYFRTYYKAVRGCGRRIVEDMF